MKRILNIGRGSNIVDISNTIRYVLSFSKDFEDFQKNLLRIGIEMDSNGKEENIVFEVNKIIFSAEEFSKYTGDDFFRSENLINHIGYNLKE